MSLSAYPEYPRRIYKSHEQEALQLIGLLKCRRTPGGEEERFPRTLRQGANITGCRGTFCAEYFHEVRSGRPKKGQKQAYGDLYLLG